MIPEYLLSVPDKQIDVHYNSPRRSKSPRPHPEDSDTSETTIVQEKKKEIHDIKIKLKRVNKNKSALSEEIKEIERRLAAIRLARGRMNAKMNLLYQNIDNVI